MVTTWVGRYTQHGARSVAGKQRAALFPGALSRWQIVGPLGTEYIESSGLDPYGVKKDYPKIWLSGGGLVRVTTWAPSLAVAARHFAAAHGLDVRNVRASFKPM